ncbi:hypothetical protein SSAG_02369 [Streptomyces sp. Mg1]|nr:hypothetical protein SSAG_02369 [Streptomyces sp. Mg1]
MRGWSADGVADALRAVAAADAGVKERRRRSRVRPGKGPPSARGPLRRGPQRR